MTVKRINELKKDYFNAFTRLKEALEERLDEKNIILDGTIQRFEFTFELAWKLMKAVLEHNDVESKTSRSAIKEAYQKELINNGKLWLDMVDDRNKTSHIYDEKQALAIYINIKDTYFGLFKEFKETVIKCEKNSYVV